MKRSAISAADTAQAGHAWELVAHKVRGLWIGGLYGIGFGMMAGLLSGASVGAAVCVAILGFSLASGAVGEAIGSLYGIISGGVIGLVLGALVGAPAAILGAGLSTRQGWRVGSALAVLLVGTCIWTATGEGIGAANGQWVTRLIALAAIATCMVIGYWLGGFAFDRVQTRDGFWGVCRRAWRRYGLDDVTDQQRAICLPLALLPVILVYGAVAGWLCFLSVQG